MLDIFPFPSVSDGNPEKQIAELVNYLIQFKETLEFALTNISTENLSPNLVNKLNELGADIEKNKEERGEEVAQIATNALTVSDVCNSEVFKVAIEVEASKYISFNVNYETGHLEYALSSKEANND